MKILKNKGLDKATYKQCYELSRELAHNSSVKKRVQLWLKQNRKIQKQIMPSLPLLVGSDIIESLFGQFKHIVERSPQADINRIVLLIPALCGTLTVNVMTKALNQASQKALQQWEVGNISPMTIMHYIGFDIHKKVISFCEKIIDGEIALQIRKSNKGQSF